jgi:hypothetical protein
MYWFAAAVGAAWFEFVYFAFSLLLAGRTSARGYGGPLNLLTREEEEQIINGRTGAEPGSRLASIAFDSLEAA